MKKTKLLIPICVFTSVATLAPVLVLSACSKNPDKPTKGAMPFDYLQITNNVLSGFSEKGLSADDFDEYSQICIPNSVTEITENAFVKESKNGIETTIPKSVKEIIFEDNKNYNLKKIGANAFSKAKCFSFYLPNSVTAIGSNVFSYSKISEINISSWTYNNFIELRTNLSFDSFSGMTADGKFIYSEQMSDSEKNKINILLYANTLIDESWFNSPIEFKDSWFKMDSLVSTKIVGLNDLYLNNSDNAKARIRKDHYTITIPASVTEIGESAFYDASSTLPESLAVINFEENSLCETISDSAFKNSNLMEMSFPASLKNISQSAFEGCTELHQLDFSKISNFNSLTISPSAFVGLENIKGVIVTSKMETSEDQALENSKWFKFLCNTCHFFFSDTGWTFLNKETVTPEIYDYSLIPESDSLVRLERVKSEYLDNNYKLTDLACYYIKNSLKIISDVTYLEQLCWVASIGNNAFFSPNTNDTILPPTITELDFTKYSEITSIGQNAFINANFSSISLPEKLTLIDSYAFGHNGEINSNIEFISLPSTLTDVRTSAFSNVNNLKTLDLSSFVIVETLNFATNSFTNLPASGTIYISQSVKSNPQQLEILEQRLGVAGFNLGSGLWELKVKE